MKLKSIFQDEPVLYYQDKQKIEGFVKDQQPVIERGNALLKTYETGTGYQVKSFSELCDLASDPQKVIHAHHTEAKAEQIKKITVAGFSFPIDYNFVCNGQLEVIESEGKKFAGLLNKTNPENFELKNGQVVIAQTALNRNEERATHYAVTPEEKTRLKLAQDLISVFERIGEHIQDLYGNRVGDGVKSLAHARPTHHYIRAVWTGSQNILIPNPMWVKEGMATTSTLGIYIHSQKEKERALKDVATYERQRSKPAPQESIISSSSDHTPSFPAYEDYKQ
jgi:hypothetical protein